MMDHPEGIRGELDSLALTKQLMIHCYMLHQNVVKMKAVKTNFFKIYSL